jgi:hypothetical protein
MVNPAAVTAETLPLLVPTTQTGLLQRLTAVQPECDVDARGMRRRRVRHHDVEPMPQEQIGGANQEVAGRIDDGAAGVEFEQPVAAGHQDDVRPRIMRRLVEAHVGRLDDERGIYGHGFGIRAAGPRRR